MRQFEALCVHVLIEGGHNGRRVIGVFQSQSMAQLMHCHQEEIIACKNTDRQLQYTYI